MHRRLLLGIDLGTTVLKACLFGAGGRNVVAAASRRLPVRDLPGGGAETPVAAVDRAFGGAVRELREAAGTSWRRIDGIGIAAQGGSSILADRDSGRPRTPMVLWNDGRAVRETARLLDEVPRSLLRRTILSDVPPAGLGRLRWLRRRHPKLFHEGTIHIGAGEHLFFRLTGAWRQDAGNAIQIGSYNAARDRLDDTLLEFAGVPVSFFAPLRRGHETSSLSAKGSRLLGLPRDVPVAGPYIDQEAGYLSVAGLSRRPLECSLGTAWVGNFVLPEGFRGHSPVQLVIPSPAGPGRLVMLPLLTGNVFWNWALEKLMGWKREDALEKAARVLSRPAEHAGALVALPWITEPNPLCAGAVGAGAFVGLGPGSDREDMLRAVAAGLVFELARVFGEVREKGIADGIVLAGGASRSRFFRDLIALLFEPLPVLRQQGEASAAARGALYAFDRKTATAGARPVGKPTTAARKALEARAVYESAFERLLGSSPGAAAYTIRRTRQ